MAVEFGFVCSCGFGEEEEYTSSDVGKCDAGCAGDPEMMCGKAPVSIHMPSFLDADAAVLLNTSNNDNKKRQQEKNRCSSTFVVYSCLAYGLCCADSILLLYCCIS